MLSAIASDPTAIPLWITLLFAVAMYPLGLLLPGCPCCGGGPCTQCGILATGYAAGQNADGRMCCNGTRPASITLRVTNVGGATSSTVDRAGGSPYTRYTRTFNCNAVAGDYVLTGVRAIAVPFSQYTCYWSASDGTTGRSMMLYAVAGAAFPDWYQRLKSVFGTSFPVTLRTQTCTGFPGPEACNIGTTSTVNQTMYLDQTGLYYDSSYITGGLLSAQACDPRGMTLLTSAPLYSNGADTGCRMKVEFV